jgi:hypothetical protein
MNTSSDRLLSKVSWINLKAKSGDQHCIVFMQRVQEAYKVLIDQLAISEVGIVQSVDVTL